VLAAQRAKQPMPVQVADVAGGSYPAVIQVLAALTARHSTNRGTMIDVNMFRAGAPRRRRRQCPTEVTCWQALCRATM
jgi:crotonobetainyl-CoA:carnitine CoA-transferase CaiB-like acyl-CoA transferase